MDKLFQGREVDSELIKSSVYAQKFIDFINEVYLEDANSTKLTYWGVYKSFIFPLEDLKNKYFYDFTTDECRILLESINTNNKRVYKTLMTLMRRYQAWAIERGYNPTGINSMAEIAIDDIELPNNLATRRYISKKDLVKKCKQIIESELSTPQHVIIWLLARYGVLNKELESAMINLRVEDIDFENKKIKFYSDIDKDFRIVDIDEGMAILLNQAIYGNVDYRMTNNKNEMLGNIGFVLRSNRNNYGTITKGILRARLYELKEVVRKNYTLKDLQLCCKIDDLRQLKEEKGILTSKDFKDVQKKYGNSVNSYSLLLDDYELITGDTIEKQKKKKRHTTIVRRKINGKMVTNEELGLTPEEMQKKYPSVNSPEGRKIAYKKKKAQQSSIQ